MEEKKSSITTKYKNTSKTNGYNQPEPIDTKDKPSIKYNRAVSIKNDNLLMKSTKMILSNLEPKKTISSNFVREPKIESETKIHDYSKEKLNEKSNEKISNLEFELHQLKKVYSS